MMRTGDRVVQIPASGPVRHGTVAESEIITFLVHWDNDTFDWYAHGEEGIWRIAGDVKFPTAGELQLLGLCKVCVTDVAQKWPL
jgi:hypothetical protein